MAYYKFFVQKETDGAAIRELGSDFGAFEVESKFYGGGETKDVPKREWYDEDGDDEFVPDVQRYKAYDMQVKFACKGEPNSANEVISALKAYLNGGTMKVFDEYNNVGRQSVRFAGIPDDGTLYRHMYGMDEALVFTVNFKVNDPSTDVSIATASGEYLFETKTTE